MFTLCFVFCIFSTHLITPIPLLQVRDNVAYDITGHAYFMEDGTETNNYVTGNLGIAIRRSSALLKVSGFDVLCGMFAVCRSPSTFIWIIFCLFYGGGN